MRLLIIFTLVYILKYNFYNSREFFFLKKASLLKVESFDNFNNLENLNSVDTGEDNNLTIDDYLLYTEFDRHVLTPTDGTENDVFDPLLFVLLNNLEAQKIGLNVFSEDHTEGEIEQEIEEIVFNKHKCMLAVKFEIEFLNNPLLHKSGIINYIKDIEINETGETKIIEEPNIVEDKYDIIKQEAKTKKLEKITSFLNKVFEVCNLITNQERLDQFKKTINYVIYKTEHAIERLERKKLDFEKQKDSKDQVASADSEQNNKVLENISIIRGKADALTMALKSFNRIKDYWMHLENLPSIV
ncbi:hypothetical protein FG386_003675 [Cryptosporidium ryanae]|uniref:uncharacterized protein n=1 Tax=Cryptosporidium ryanae TaxID=515981 RepID=UPI00351A1501|nr:hypothetical protein FG386_003675 [Cryptosporidium ryanae]